ncbi:MAG: hypothetical protein LBC42_03310, partial [Puniceicoccales bacterium]|nr:hypothetical protein [Puniceicoccales bacterium]
MKVSIQWLRRWLPRLHTSAEEIAEALTTLGIEVEGVEHFSVPQSHLIVGEVESFEPHPRADRLRLCRIKTSADQSRQIVCGAHNFSAGDRVPVALPGCSLPDGREIQLTQLRGVESDGMLCSAEELGL